MNIPEHRKAIDKLDTQIVKLLNDRTQHVLEIGAIKVKAGEEIYAPHRERAVLQRICRLNQGPITSESLRAIYREVMSSALSLEKSMTIAYLGPEATFTHQAAIRRFGSSLRYAGREFHRRRRHPHARHVRGQRFEDRFANHFADSTLPDEQISARPDQEIIRPPANARPMPRLDSKPFARPGNH
jgi:chorismate mutase-like protein